MSSIQNKIVDAVFQGNDELTCNLVRELSYVKTRKILGLLESGEVTIRGNDIFVGGNTVGSFETKDDKIEFTASNDGAVQTFENDEELMNYVAGLNEELTEFKTPDIKKTDVDSSPKSGIKAPEGYDKHELSSQHKDERMETPKKNDHGHDSKQEEPKASGGSNPTDKETELKSAHSHDPKTKGHGHDDPSGVGKVEKKGK